MRFADTDRLAAGALVDADCVDVDVPYPPAPAEHAKPPHRS